MPGAYRVIIGWLSGNSGGSEGRKKASVVHGVLTLISCSRWVGNDPRKKIGGGRKLFRVF